MQPSPSPSRPGFLAGLTLPRLWALIVLAGIWLLLCLSLVRPHDFWWHVRAGQWIVDNGRVPATDLFSYTRAGEPYAFALSWLAEVALFGLLRAGGLPLVLFAHAGLVTAAYGLLMRVAWRAAGGNLRWAALATLAAAAVGLDSWNVRPQSFSILFFTLTLSVLERRSAAPSRAGTVWALPPLFAVWANTHGAFVLGLALLSCDLLAEAVGWLRRRERFPWHLAAVCALSAAATLLNPQGPATLAHALGILSHPGVRFLTVEWAPVTLRTQTGQVFFAFVAGWIALLLISGYRPTLGQALRLVIFGTLAVMAGRNALWFGLVAAPVAAARLQAWATSKGQVPRARLGRPAVNLAFVAVLALLLVLSLPWLRPHLPLPEGRLGYLSAETPVRAADALCRLPDPGRLFHSEADGSYLIWACPTIPVFVDTRIELYPPAQWGDYLALSSARHDWQALLDRYGVQTLLLHRGTHDHLIRAASASPLWQATYQDELSVILTRRSGP